MTKISILNTEGKKTKEMDLPSFFSKIVRKDIISKFIETKKTAQPYSPSPVAGNQASASGKLRHRRHVWKSQYGRGMSRIPRKTMLRRGSQFNWTGATIPSTVGGRRAHPPKTLSAFNTKKINKKEAKIALMSALSATANKPFILQKYSSIDEEKIKDKKFPLIVENKISDLKVKDLKKALEKILGKALYSIGIPKRAVRAGKGKLRGRKYKKSAGLLLVVSDKEQDKLKTKTLDIVPVTELEISDLAKTKPGRLTIYTEDAVKELNEKIENKEKGK
jgi:large subunit ribosomal protein L4e